MYQTLVIMLLGLFTGTNAFAIGLVESCENQNLRIVFQGLSFNELGEAKIGLFENGGGGTLGSGTVVARRGRSAGDSYTFFDIRVPERPENLYRIIPKDRDSDTLLILRPKSSEPVDTLSCVGNFRQFVD